MKKIGIFLIILGLVFLPFSVDAASKKYNTLDLVGTLNDEEIEKAYKEYKPNSDAITIYLFRGKGCGFCRAYLEFMNSIADEYGKYFVMETYEVWNDSNNNTLMNEVSTFLGNPATGVPYIIIGDQVFAGYNNTYDDSIKETIKKLYDTKKSKRYDVMKEMNKKNKGTNLSITDNTIVWNLIYAIVSTGIIITYINLKFKELSLKIDNTATSKSNKKQR